MLVSQQRPQPMFRPLPKQGNDVAAAIHYVKPSHRPLWVNVAAIIIYGALAWTIVSQVEKWRNPANFPLEVLQRIQEQEQMVYRKYRDEDEQAAAQ